MAPLSRLARHDGSAFLCSARPRLLPSLWAGILVLRVKRAFNFGVRNCGKRKIIPRFPRSTSWGRWRSSSCFQDAFALALVQVVRSRPRRPSLVDRVVPERPGTRPSASTETVRFRLSSPNPPDDDKLLGSGAQASTRKC